MVIACGCGYVGETVVLAEDAQTRTRIVGCPGCCTQQDRDNAKYDLEIASRRIAHPELMHEEVSDMGGKP